MTGISRDELLRGLPARRADMLLFAIESRTAQLVARSRQATALTLTEQTAEARERAFLAALAHGRELSGRVTIQDLERYARRWADLVPPDPLVRAASLHLLGERVRLPAARVPALREALGADDRAVRDAYERLHGRELATIYAVRFPLGERVRWTRADASHRLETLPPFWTAFALTLTGTVGTTTLALPIAIATVGPAAGIGLLLGLAAVTILTIAAMSEAVTRSGAMRYSSSYLGRLVADLLGGTAASLFTFAALLAVVFALLVRFIGFASTLASAVAVPAAAWAALLFLVNLRFLRRGTFDSTLASTLVVGAVNVALIALLSLIALPHVSASRLSDSGAGLLDGPALGLAFGVALGVYARRISVGSAAKAGAAARPERTLAAAWKRRRPRRCGGPLLPLGGGRERRAPGRHSRRRAGNGGRTARGGRRPGRRRGRRSVRDPGDGTGVDRDVAVAVVPRPRVAARGSRPPRPVRDRARADGRTVRARGVALDQRSCVVHGRDRVRERYHRTRPQRHLPRPAAGRQPPQGRVRSRDGLARPEPPGIGGRALRVLRRRHAPARARAVGRPGAASGGDRRRC